MEQITYKYNIRGWLTGINDMEHPGENRFVMQLDYNQAETPRYNGNIGSMSWQSAHFATPKQYHFNYDNANRLLTATYADAGKYTTHYTYDKNGNIENLTRMGELGGSNTYGYIDQLTYAYTGNQLKYVNDNTGDNHQNNGFTDNGSLLTTNEYFYDLNGNLTRDLNKQINHIEYNYLNLPRRIDLSGANLNTINYLYSANGVKLQKNTSISHARSAPTDYLGTIVYPGDAPAYIFTPEGRALRNDQGNFDYEYFLKDHLGNTRVSFNQKGTILQDNSYYPFGMGLGEALTYVDNTATENKYLYNGKEMQDDFGLGWYDYGARMYDAELGRWHVVDPLAEYHFNFTPYNYCLNNPINYKDIFGLDTTINLEEVEIIDFQTPCDCENTRQYGGFVFYWPGSDNGGEETRSGDGSEESLDIGLFLNVFAGMPHMQGLNMLGFLKWIKNMLDLNDKVQTVVKEVSDSDTPEIKTDKEILEENTDTTEKKNDSITVNTWKWGERTIFNNGSGSSRSGVYYDTTILMKDTVLLENKWTKRK